MSVFAKHPKYIDFINNEIKTLGFIRNQEYLATYSDLVTKADTLYNIYQGVKPRHIKTQDFQFECELELVVESRRRRVFLGANVKTNYSAVSYMLAVCESNNDNQNLIRKFHFDYAPPIKGQPPKPVYHIQYGGVESNLLNENEISANHLYPKISSPRLYGVPINLALVLDITFCEFESDETAKIVKNPQWKEFIKSNESFILKPYYERMKEFVSNGHSSTRLMRDFYYGE